MQQNLFRNLSFLFLCNAFIFRECFQAADESLCVEGGRLRSGPVECVCVCVWLCLLIVEGRGSFSPLMTISLLRCESFPVRWLIDTYRRVTVSLFCAQSWVLVTLLHPLINIRKWKLCVGLGVHLKGDNVYTAHAAAYTACPSGQGQNPIRGTIDLIQKQRDSPSVCVYGVTCIYLCVSLCLTYQGVLSWETQSAFYEGITEAC